MHAKNKVTPTESRRVCPRFFLSTGHPYGITSLMFSISDLANQCDGF